jgi:hypothetical protein
LRGQAELAFARLRELLAGQPEGFVIGLTSKPANRGKLRVIYVLLKRHHGIDESLDRGRSLHLIKWPRWRILVGRVRCRRNGLLAHRSNRDGA